MVLAIALFGAVFSSLVWFAFAIRFISVSLAGMSFFDAGLTNVVLYVLFVCLPEFVIWMIFGFINQYFNNKFLGSQMYKLFLQMKKNQEYSDLLSRIMLQTGEGIRSSFMMNHFELLVSDINELLSEIIQRENLVTKAQSEDLWGKIQSGGKWFFGKVIVENYNKTPSFKKKIYDDAVKDNVLAGVIMEFCARYQSLVGLLEKYDKEKTCLSVVETGVLGKVFSVLAPISDELRKVRLSNSLNKEEEPSAETPLMSVSGEAQKRELPRIRSEKRDDFSLALERSFSSDVEAFASKETEHKEPVFTTWMAEEDISGADENVPDSQKALNSLKKEWREMEIKQDSSEDSLAYPFGGWTDADKYQK